MPSPASATVLVGADGSAAAERAVSLAAREAAYRCAALHIVYAVEVPIEVGPTFGYAPVAGETCRAAGQAIVEAARETAEAAAAAIGAIEIETFVRDAAPIPLLRDRSAEAGLLVTGTRGLGTLRRGLLGSVSTSLARHAHCPVAIVPEQVPDPSAPVVVGVDGSPRNALAIEIAVDQALRCDSELVAVHARTGSSRDMAGDQRQEAGEDLLARALAGYHARCPELRVLHRVIEDRPARAVLTVAEHAQLIVVGSHARGRFAGLSRGSVSDAVLHAASCPVVIAHVIE